MGRGPRLHGREDPRHQGHVRTGVPRDLRPHHRRLLVHRLLRPGLGHTQCCEAVVVVVPEPAGRGVHAHTRLPRWRTRADGLGRDRVCRVHRKPRRRGQPQHRDAGLRRGTQPWGADHRRRSALLHRRSEGRPLAADQARHRYRPVACMGQRSHRREPVRRCLHRRVGQRVRRACFPREGLHAGVGSLNHRAVRRSDSCDSPGYGRAPPEGGDHAGTPHHLVRQRFPAYARGVPRQLAARCLRPARRDVLQQVTVPRFLPTSAVCGHGQLGRLFRRTG